ncbi:MAG TPA: sigma-54 dependent transcriptional regulator [Myxococcota bacterium]|nr:sigma-54 dependent transcriptional regulator [Myxococcota bacterium]HQK49861.1 sigma-54 dependent transcriptional regulator [Myxococcota bacterium]
MAWILVVEDDVPVRSFVADALRASGHRVEEAGEAATALERVRGQDVDVVITDLKMPGRSGLDLLRDVRALADPPEVVVLTAHGTVSAAVEAIKAGAFDFLEKPVPGPEALRIVVERALERRRLARDVERLRAGQRPREGEAEVVAADASTRSLLERLRRVAASDATVLLLGESGTGKEVFARELHRLRLGSGTPFVAVNCAAIPEHLLESELFGHEKGAFTGAGERRIGLLEAASDGTLFLDEIGEMPLSLQPKLLRVLETREFTRVGGTRTLRTDARFVAATHRDLAEAVRAGTFREDLYYRLEVLPLRIPPLRERPQDVEALAEHFLERQRRRTRRLDLQLSPEARDLLTRYDWPGNVRELRNAIERACVLAEGPVILPEDLGLPVRLPESEEGLLARQERETVLRVLREVGGNRKAAAARLGISLRTLQYRLKEYGLVER